MKRIYTFGHEEVQRNLTVGDIIENKANDVKMTQVTAQNAEEAEILAEQDIDMIITGSDWYEDVRSGAPNTFITAALFAGRYITNDEILELMRVEQEKQSHAAQELQLQPMLYHLVQMKKNSNSLLNVEVTY